MNVKNKAENAFWILLTCYLLLPFAFIYLFSHFVPLFELKDAKSFLRTRTTWQQQKLVCLFFISCWDQRLRLTDSPERLGRKKWKSPTLKVFPEPLVAFELFHADIFRVSFCVSAH